MNPIPTQVRRNATRQDAEHLGDILDSLNVETEGCAHVLRRLHAAMENSFYAALCDGHSPLLELAEKMENLEVQFFRAEPANPNAQAAAMTFGAGLRPVVREPRELTL